MDLYTVRYFYKFFLDDNLFFYKRRLAQLANKFQGKRCFIMGNGPSLNKTPLELLEKEYVWGVNRCNLLFEQLSWRPKFYIAIDKVVVPDNAEEIKNMIKALRKTIFFFPFYFNLRGLIPSSKNVYWYREKIIKNDNSQQASFSIDVKKYVQSSSTVTIAALQIAVFLGFNPIYLIGCDTNYHRNGEIVPREDGSSFYFVGKRNDDIDHFNRNYFGKGKAFNPPSPERMINNYKQVKKACDSLGVEVYNATIGGKLEVFPRVKFENLF